MSDQKAALGVTEETKAPEEKPHRTSNDWVKGRVTRVVIVAAGASSSTPKLGCVLRGDSNTCAACKDSFENPSSPNNRLNPCLLIQTEAELPGEEHREGAEQDSKTAAPTKLKGNILIDVCKTFRESTMKVLVPMGVRDLNSVILTHDHADATLGLDDLREFSSYRDASKGKVDIPLSAWSDKRTNESMQRVFPYLFPKPGVFRTYVAQIEWSTFEHFKPFMCCGVPVTPFPVEHGPGYISNGYSFPTPEGTIVYISDVSMIPQQTYDFIKTLHPLKLLVLDLLGLKETPVHFNEAQSIEAAKKIGAPQTFFVGMSHTMEYHETNERFVKGPFQDKEAVLGRDGLVVYDPVNPETVGKTVLRGAPERKLALQVAGHGGIFYAPEHGGETVLRKPTRTQEAIFYTHVFSDPLLAELRPWVPKYLGHSIIEDTPAPTPPPAAAILTGSSEQDDKKEGGDSKEEVTMNKEKADTAGKMCMLDLGNLCAGMTRPCVVDIKIGAVRYTPQTTEETIKKILNKVGEGPESSPAKHYLRVSGSNQWRRKVSTTSTQGNDDGDDDKSWSLHQEGKSRGRKQSRTEFCDSLKEFCSPQITIPVEPETNEESTAAQNAASSSVNSNDFSIALAKSLREQLNQILQVVRSTNLLEKYSLTAASVLLVYDAAALSVSSQSSSPPDVCVRLIDFGRSGPRDPEGTLHFPDSVIKFEPGLANLVSMFDEVIDAMEKKEEKKV